MNDGIMVIEDGTGSEFSHKLRILGYTQDDLQNQGTQETLDDVCFFCEDEGYKVTCRNDLQGMTEDTILVVYSGSANASRAICQEIKNLFFQEVY